MRFDRATLRWTLRPTLLFVASFAINASVHEAAHAFAAVALGMPARLFHIYASVDLAAAMDRVSASGRASGTTRGSAVNTPSTSL